MNFLRWLILKKMVDDMSSDSIFATFMITMIIGGFLTAITWPWLVPVYLIVLGFWGFVGYLHAERVWKEWREEYNRNK